VNANADDLAIAIDLGGTQIRAALIDRQGVIHIRCAEPTRATAGPETVIGQIAALAAKAREGFDAKRIIGAGVSSPGPIDTMRGVALAIPTLMGFNDFPLRARLEGRLGMTVALENDGISAALGEWRHGAGKGISNLVYVTVSTGIGGGVILGNRVLRGRQGMAGHVGHMSFMQDGETCACGNRGCFEAYASATAFTRRAIMRAAADPATRLGKTSEPIDAAAVFEAARQGDGLAKALVQEEAQYLGQGFASLLHLFNPDVLIMGGGLSNQFDDLQGDIVASLQSSAMPAFRNTPIRRAALGENSGLHGAASLIFEGA
jgi:glucokinase